MSIWFRRFVNAKMSEGKEITSAWSHKEKDIKLMAVVMGMAVMVERGWSIIKRESFVSGSAKSIFAVAKAAERVFRSGEKIEGANCGESTIVVRGDLLRRGKPVYICTSTTWARCRLC
jgi:hypothetical protein